MYGGEKVNKLPQGLFYITALAVIQYYRYNKKIKIKMDASRPFLFYFINMCHVLILCET